MKLKKYDFAKVVSSKVILSDYETRTIIGGASLIDDETAALSYNEMIEVYGEASFFPSYVFDHLDMNPMDLGTSDLNILSGMTFNIRLSDLNPFFIAHWGLCSDGDGSTYEDYSISTFLDNVTNALAAKFGNGAVASDFTSVRNTLSNTLSGYSSSFNLSYTIEDIEGVNNAYMLVINNTASQTEIFRQQVTR